MLKVEVVGLELRRSSRHGNMSHGSVRVEEKLIPSTIDYIARRRFAAMTRIISAPLGSSSYILHLSTLEGHAPADHTLLVGMSESPDPDLRDVFRLLYDESEWALDDEVRVFEASS